MPISPGGTHAHIYTRHVPMHISVESGYLLYLQNQEKENKVIYKWIHVHQSRSATYTFGRVPRSLFKTACWMLDAPALQHAACVGVLVMVQHLRLAEIHCMHSLEYMLCQGECLDIPILQCMHAVFTDRRRRRKGRGHTQ